MKLQTSDINCQSCLFNLIHCNLQDPQVQQFYKIKLTSVLLGFLYKLLDIEDLNLYNGK